MAASLTSRLLTELLPPDLAASLRQHLFNPRAPLQIYKRQLSWYLHRGLASIQPHVQPLVDRLTDLVFDNQSLMGMVVLLAVLAGVVMVMNWIRRLVMWWTRLALRAVFWAGVMLVVAWVWNRGVGESLREGAVVGGKVVGYLGLLRDFWVQEYERYEANGSRGRGTRGRSSWG
ncbi:hypothetical protein E4U09_006666 [Claviceps aff. purpurea]|uniref:Uncharacterized protein n=1 Tax=Claviceps aff. purpurea TaxID=1967640 RepID=A0A9P7QKC6_9HYPO|nr:hypothetical protein E4U61_003138 [Claviceps capensis]KAG6130569.1 hypothetical protein E4U12_004143 [Claviceps purpurea]KAG6300581.1 hypothetical protein E4U09_006666 [Claviceps aff. purpurea]KAG6141689.1 hypothetical protein E4U38_006429 [Claviceps purpurea]KAG6159594.1 hypothetical protein E4U37_002955 [Claviceps purpurea]